MLKEGIGQFACYPLPSIRFATAREETPTVHGVVPGTAKRSKHDARTVVVARDHARRPTKRMASQTPGVGAREKVSVPLPRL